MSANNKNDNKVFSEPWHAHLFALGLLLYEKNLLSESQWRDIRSESSPEISLSKLEKAIISQNILDEQSLTHRFHQWREAILSTPHGEPIVLP